jgi:hypothetical protein
MIIIPNYQILFFLMEGEEEYLVEEILDSKCFTEDFASLSSGKDTAWNTIPGNMLWMSMHQNA